MISKLIEFAKELASLPKNVRETAEQFGKGNFSKAGISYGKTIPGAAIIAKFGPSGAKALSSVFNNTTVGKTLSQGVTLSGNALSKAASWWLQPAKQVGVSTKTVTAGGLKKVGISTLGKLTVVPAVIGGEHLFSKASNSVSTITYVGSIFNKDLRDKVLDGKRPSTTLQKIGDFMIAGPQRRAILKVIRKIEGGNK